MGLQIIQLGDSSGRGKSLGGGRSGIPGQVSRTPGARYILQAQPPGLPVGISGHLLLAPSPTELQVPLGQRGSGMSVGKSGWGSDSLHPFLLHPASMSCTLLSLSSSLVTKDPIRVVWGFEPRVQVRSRGPGTQQR